jgi:hypothetical protein
MTADLATSATTAEPWTRALQAGLAKHGPTPIYEQLVAEYAGAS